MPFHFAGIPRPRPGPPVLVAVFLVGAVLSACDGGSPFAVEEDQCVVPLEWFQDGGVGQDAIPALTNPTLVPTDHPEAQYMRGAMRVIGIRSGSRTIAVAHDLLWWHEIVNLSLPEGPVAITYCPLTGSSLVFDRAALGGRAFGVSGLLFLTNLVMYDRGTPRASLWLQMAAAAACGPERGEALPLVAHQEMTWWEWQELHPETEVVAESSTLRAQGADFYPYGDYETNQRVFLGFPRDLLDERRLGKERVLGIPGRDGGIAFPFGRLTTVPTVATDEVDGEPVVVFSTPLSRSAAAFHPVLDGQTLQFRVEERRIVDDEKLETGPLPPLPRAVCRPVPGQCPRRVQIAMAPQAWAFWSANSPGSSDNRL